MVYKSTKIYDRLVSLFVCVSDRSGKPAGAFLRRGLATDSAVRFLVHTPKNF